MLLHVLCLAAANPLLAVRASPRSIEETRQFNLYMWGTYKRDWNKVYATAEEDERRFSNFISNLKLAAERNEAERAVNGTAMYGITKFSDMSMEEFRAHFLKSDPALKKGKGIKVKVEALPAATLAKNEFIDWTGTLTTPVKDQGYCGSCWAFSATEQIESDAMRVLGSSYILSPQQITSCDQVSGGCDGGFTESAYEYVRLNGGIEQDSDYPYTSYEGRTGNCKAEESLAVIKVNQYYTVDAATENGIEDAMATYVQKTGPLSVCVAAETWNLYTGGIVTRCPIGYVDHCVQAVGVQTGNGGFWKVRNSWGTSWGESGYIRLAYGANTCSITNDATYVDVSLPKKG